MLANFSQYAPQGLAPQFPGLPGIGAPQLNAALLGQPGVYANAWSGQELGQQGGNQQVPPWAGQINPFAYQPLTQSPFILGSAAQNPNLQSQGAAGSPLHNPTQMVPVLGQLAQQLAIQSALTHQVAQHIGVAVQHLAHQLAVQNQQGQYYGQNPFAPSMQGGYSGFNPQSQAWGGNRPPTIQ
jgi:hypothetical protein